ncbi:MAG: GNAT family N-acetyltransferase [Candidatus Coproplasma sp.]
MIKIRLLSSKNFRINSLDYYKRTQEVKRVYRKNSAGYILKDLPYIEDWSLEEKRQIAANISNSEHITYLALDGQQVIGFISLKNKLHGKFCILDYLHVSADCRGQGIGKVLFKRGIEVAKCQGAEYIYISVCSSEETVAFYRVMGAKLTHTPIKEIAEKEPYDLQLIYSLK